MSQPKKFIITSDESIHNALVESGFCLLSEVCGTYTFANTKHVNFNFESIDIKKIAYTDRLTF